MSRNQILNGELEIFRIKDSAHDEIIEFAKENYIKNDVICKGVNMIDSPPAVAECEALLRHILKDNLGYIVRQTNTADIVAMALGKFVAPSFDFVASAPKFQTPAVLQYIKAIRDVKGSFDIFKEWNIDCAVEIFFLVTRKDYNGRGICETLVNRLYNIAQNLNAGTLSQERVNAIPQQFRELKPKAIVSVATSAYLKKMGKNLGFQKLAETPYTEVVYDGKSFADLVDPVHKSIMYVGKKL